MALIKLNKTDFWLRLRRGLFASINSSATLNRALEGEPFYTTDTKDLYINDGTTNNLVGGVAALAAKQPLDATLTSIAGVSGVQGDLLYASGTDAWTRLAKDTGASKFLSNQGTSNNPAWATILGSDITGAALTKTDDTNVTLTLGGAPTTALLRAASLTLGWTGTLGVARGGTNIASYAVGDLIYASGATTLSKLAGVATGNALISGGVTTAPSWGKIGLTTHVSGTLPIANGGTGATTLAGASIPVGTGTANYLTKWSGTNTITNSVLQESSGLVYRDTTLINDLATKNTNAITLYVNSATGNDSNTGATDVTALATIQEAIDRLPELIDATATIYCEGAFTEDVDTTGVIGSGTIDIIARKNGVVAFFTGTATGGTGTTLTFTSSLFSTGHFDGGKLWVVSGTGYGQVVDVTTHTVSGTTNTINVASWPTATPDATSFFTVITGVTNTRSTTTAFSFAGLLPNLNLRGFWCKVTTAGDTSPAIVVQNKCSLNLISCLLDATRGIQITESSTLSGANGSLCWLVNNSSSIGLFALAGSYTIPRGMLFKAQTAGVGQGINIQNHTIATFTASAGSSGISSFVDLAVGAIFIQLAAGNLTSSQNFSGCTVDWTQSNDNSTGMSFLNGAMSTSGNVNANDFRDYVTPANNGSAGVFAVQRNDSGVAANDVIGNYLWLTNDTQVTTDRRVAKIDAIAQSTWTSDAAPTIMRFFTQGSTVAGGLLQAMQIDHAQKVSIGNTSASARLHVTESTLGNEVQRLDSTSTNDDPTVSTYQNRVATTDATVTTLHTYTLATSYSAMLVAHVVARRTGGSSGTANDSAGYIIRAMVKNVSGTATIVGAVSASFTAEDQAAWDATIDVTGATARVRVTGAANNNVTWHLSKLEVNPIST